MRRFLSLFTVLMLTSVLAFSQSRVVSGRVTDKGGNPIAFASVTLKGSKIGVSADAYGAYTIKVKDGDILVISYTAFVAQEVTILSGINQINTVLAKNENQLTEVVVTSAVGIKKTQRSQSSNVQNVSAEQLNTIRQPNLNNALAGKVAGAQVRSQSAAALGRETIVRLRGENGLGVSGGPIYVVDGTIIPSANDINPDDIEDVTVLQGPSAAALFGPDGSNGAIVVNTKRAKKGAKGIGLEMNSGVTFDKVYILPNYQNQYAGGAAGDLIKYTWQAGQPDAWKALDGKYYHEGSDDASWGPRMVGQEYIPWYAWYPGSDLSYKTAKLTPQPNNARDFFETGITKTNNVSFSKATDNINFRASYTNMKQTGLIPTQYLNRHTLNINTTVDLSPKWVLGTSINYIAQNRNADNDDGYANQTTGSFNQWFHRDVDVKLMKQLKGLKSPEGILASWNHNNVTAYNPANPVAFYGGNYWFNYDDFQENITQIDRRDRLFGDVSLTYKINSDLKVRATYRKQQLTTNFENIGNSILEQSQVQAGWNIYEGNGKAFYGSGNSFSDRQNYEGLITYNKKIGKDFSLNALSGFEIVKTRFRDITANTMGGLNVPGLYSLANSKNPINYGNTRQQSARRGMYVKADFGFRNYLFVEGTFRRDYSSTEPRNHFIDTKSIGGSFVFSDLIKDKVPFVTYGKLRASMGQILNTLGIYQLNTTYTVNPNQWNGNFLMSEPDGLVDPKLNGATNDEKEIGIDLRFLKNRLGFSATYWDRTNKNFPVNVTVSQTSGYGSVNTNAGEIAKTGVDLTFFVKPIKSRNFDWDINATWGRLLKNEVVDIAPGITRLVSQSGAFAGSYAAYIVSEKGKKWGQLFGGGYKRINGERVLDANGFFVKEADVKFGSALPDYTGGVQNTFNILKNFVINVNIDYSWGGKFFSLSHFWGSFSGLTAETAGINDKGNPVRDLVANGGGVHVFGVDGTGKPVDYYVEGQDYFHQFQGSRISENSVFDLTFVKMRELSVGYKIPTDDLKIGKYIRNATFSLTARNPVLIYRKQKDFDPSEISGAFGEDGNLPGTRGFGVNLKVGF